jgi:hypothetical protein
VARRRARQGDDVTDDEYQLVQWMRRVAVSASSAEGSRKCVDRWMIDEGEGMKVVIEADDEVIVWAAQLSLRN